MTNRYPATLQKLRSPLTFSANVDVDEVRKKYGIETVFKNIILVCEWLARDENVQVNGVQVFVDMTAITMAHSTNMMTPENGKRLLQFYQVGYILTSKFSSICWPFNGEGGGGRVVLTGQ